MKKRFSRTAVPLCQPEFTREVAQEPGAFTYEKIVAEKAQVCTSSNNVDEKADIPVDLNEVREKPLGCEKCGKQFKRSAILKRHALLTMRRYI